MRTAFFLRLPNARRALTTAMLTTALAHPAAALTINPVFTASVTTAADAAQYEFVVNTAISTIESLYSNPGSISIVFDQSNSSGYLGQSQAYDVSSTYANYTAALSTVSQNQPTNTILATAVANFAKGNTTASGGSVLLTQAQAQLVFGQQQTGCFSNTGSILGSCTSTNLGLITLSSYYPMNYTTSAVGGQYSALDTVLHEINEVLGGGGQGSLLNAIAQGANQYVGSLGVLDLYRYSGIDTPSLTTSSTATAYFSVDGGVTNIVGFNQSSSGDFADFSTNSNVQSAFSPAGTIASYTPTSPETAMLAAIGYNPSVAGNTPNIPEPGTLALLATGLAGISLMRRRTRTTGPARLLR